MNVLGGVVVMRLYFYGFIMLIKKFVFRQNTGKAIKWFSQKMGVIYIKLAQILAMQNYGNLFTEKDRLELSSICDNCNPIRYEEIIHIIEKEYQCKISDKFKKIYEEPIGSASISQVHKAILKNGKVVAIKVKRRDITKRLEKDIKQIKRIIHRFGKYAKFKNYLGSDTALSMYLDWIYEEIDFIHEKNNIIEYSRFAKEVNGKVKGTHNIKVPYVYTKLCTENIIVMEFISSQTINNLPLNNYNKKKINNALNDYIQLSFWALFQGTTVVFHGDPHGGNIYIDKENNIGFLDMGLIFSFSGEESKFIRKLFFNAYHNNYEKLTELLLENSNSNHVNIESLKQGIQKCCSNFKNVSVTYFFVDMINLFTRYNIEPPHLLFKMAKAFVALNGINTFTDNQMNTEQLLINQITEYYVRRTVNDWEEVVKAGITILPSFLKNTMQNGLIAGISEEVISLGDLNKKVMKAVENLNETLDYLK